MPPEHVVEIELHEHVIVPGFERAGGDRCCSSCGVGDLSRPAPDSELVIDVFGSRGVQRILTTASEIVELWGWHDEGLQAPVDPDDVDGVDPRGAVTSDGG